MGAIYLGQKVQTCFGIIICYACFLTTMGADQNGIFKMKNFVVISARHSLRSFEVRFLGTSSFPIKHLTASEYIGL